jgi:iron-sulfur cluster assembly accessory protein
VVYHIVQPEQNFRSPRFREMFQKNSLPTMSFYHSCLSLAALAAACAFQCRTAQSFSPSLHVQRGGVPPPLGPPLRSSSADVRPPPASLTEHAEPPEDAIIRIKPRAMSRLVELKRKRDVPDDDPLILRMGVRNGGCSGLSYVMDFSTADEITDEDAVDEYLTEGIRCVVDAKSVLYLYGLELDYSDELIGGGFKFFNPNAEESCGCGSSFGV